MSKLAPRNSSQAAEFLKAQHKGSLKWRALCLMLQRQARGLPAVYPSALAAQESTPVGERVHKVKDLRRGMVAYSDEINDNNPYGHIYYIAGWKGPKSDANNCMTWTNDMVRMGGVDLVPITAYLSRWGDNFQFGATWLNGYDFSEFDKPPVETRGSLGTNYFHAMEDIEKSIATHRKKGHAKLVKALENDLARMKRKATQWSKD